MLEELRVKSFAIVDDATIELAPGLNVLSGETGAGKTLIIGALQLLLGERLLSDMTWPTSDETVIEGRFVLDGETLPAPERLQDISEDTKDFDSQDDFDFYGYTPGDQNCEFIVRRSITQSKKSKFYINGHMATAKDIAKLAVGAIEIFGQHEQMQLTKPKVRKLALDRYCGISTEKLEELNHQIREIDKAVSLLGGDSVSLSHETELLGFQLSEIQEAKIASDSEDEELAGREEVLSSVSALKEISAEALGLLGGQERDSYLGARDQLAAAVRLLAAKDYFQDITERLSGCLAELGDSISELRKHADLLEDDPAELEAVRLRRNYLHKLCHKYGGTLKDVRIKAEEIEKRLLEISTQDDLRNDLAVKKEKLLADKAVLEKEIGDIRRKYAPQLAQEVEKYLADLNLANARFLVELADNDFAGEVDFSLAANKGEPAAPLGKAASGGELSRVMLALKAVLSEGAGTYVFDEIDAGIGGQTALAVGRLLSFLAKSRQVIVVTHLAQVAAFADRHFVVEKIADSLQTKTLVKEVTGDLLIAELARMLSGQPESETALNHARELKEQVKLSSV